jgi:ATP-dependent DNA ligase
LNQPERKAYSGVARFDHGVDVPNPRRGRLEPEKRTAPTVLFFCRSSYDSMSPMKHPPQKTSPPAAAKGLRAPYPPMEAKPVSDIPVGKHWQYEPKWDGFRCLIFRNGAAVELQSKSGRSLTRYFPELAAEISTLKKRKFVLDGEILVPQGNVYSFDALLQRIHPAASRIRTLAAQTPAALVVFDILAIDDRILTQEVLKARRKILENFASVYLKGHARITLSRATPKVEEARKWLRQGAKGLDGVVAKRDDLPYQSGNRSGMQKIKRFRSADCVVGGFRYGTGNKLVGSLLLGLYDDGGLLNHVGFTSSIAAKDKRDLTRKLEALIAPPGFTGAKPGGPSRWATERSAEWNPLKPKLVAEVCYDHFTDGRFRHGTRFLRWRPDKAPQQCTLEQIS